MVLQEQRHKEHLIPCLGKKPDLGPLSKGREEMGMPKLLLSRTWKSSLSLQPTLLPCILIFGDLKFRGRS